MDSSIRQVLVVEIDLEPRRLALFQALLQGEGGLATIRCRDPERRKQQLWSTPSQREELYAWFDSLPEVLAPQLLGEWRLDGDEKR